MSFLSNLLEDTFIWVVRMQRFTMVVHSDSLRPPSLWIRSVLEILYSSRNQEVAGPIHVIHETWIQISNYYSQIWGWRRTYVHGSSNLNFEIWIQVSNKTLLASPTIVCISMTNIYDRPKSMFFWPQCKHTDWQTIFFSYDPP